MGVDEELKNTFYQVIADIRQLGASLPPDIESQILKLAGQVTLGTLKLEDAKAIVTKLASDYRINFIRTHPAAIESWVHTHLYPIYSPHSVLYHEDYLDRIHKVEDACVQKILSTGNLSGPLAEAEAEVRRIIAEAYQKYPQSAIAAAVQAGVPVQQLVQAAQQVGASQVMQLLQQQMVAAIQGMGLQLTWQNLQAYQMLSQYLQQMTQQTTAAISQQVAYLQDLAALEYRRQQMEAEANKILEEMTRQQTQISASQVQVLQQVPLGLDKIASMLYSPFQALTYTGVLNEIERVDWKAWGEKFKAGENILGDIKKPAKPVIPEGLKRAHAEYGVGEGVDVHRALDLIVHLFADLLEAVTIGEIKWNFSENRPEPALKPVEGPWADQQFKALERAAGFFLVINTGNFLSFATDFLARAISLTLLWGFQRAWNNIIWSTGLPWMSWVLTGAKVRAAIGNHLEAMANYEFQSRYPSVSEAKDMYATAYIDDKMFYNLMRFQGYPDWQIEFERIDSFKKLSESDIEELLLAGKMSPDEAYVRLKLLRYDKETAKRKLEMMLEKKRVDLKKKLYKLAESDYKNYRINDDEALSVLKTYWQDDQLAQIDLQIWKAERKRERYKTLSETWIERLWEDGVFSDAEAYQRLLLLSYTPEDAAKILNYWKRHKKKAA